MSNLLPCPFCGGEAYETSPEQNGSIYWRVTCQDCHVWIGGTHRTMNREAWNTRATTETEQVLDACEAANFKHLQRIDKLEQFCRDLWICAHEPKCCNCPKYQGEDTDCEVLNAQRMDALGLLEGD